MVKNHKQIGRSDKTKRLLQNWTTIIDTIVGAFCDVPLKFVQGAARIMYRHPP